MTKQEIKEKLEKLENDALNIDQLEAIATALREAGLDNNMNPVMRKAVMIGYAEIIKKVYRNTKYIWLGLYQLGKTLDEDIKAEPEPTIDEDTTEDDIPKEVEA